MGVIKLMGSVQDKENSDPDPEDPEDREEVDRTEKVLGISRSDEDEVMVVEKLKTGKKKTRSVSSVIDMLQSHCAIGKI